MATRDEFRLKLLKSLEPQPPDPRDGVADTDLELAPELILEALKATPGAADVLDELSGVEDVIDWVEVAYFSVCLKRGYARYLDIWDSDQFDGFTDMRQCLRDCRVWFSAEGFGSWGSGETKTGRVNCYFHAPSDGNYVCTAILQSYPSSQSAAVECLIDSSSFGTLGFVGIKHQPHPCFLAKGGHHFRIRQLRGSFFFLALMVHRV